MDLGRAADISSNILTAFGMEASELDGVVDKLTYTFTNSNTSMEQLGEAFKYVGPVAMAAGLDFGEVAAMLGMLGDAGIQGSMAGTTLRGAITRLISPTQKTTRLLDEMGVTVTDASGQMLPMVDILAQFPPVTADSAQAMLQLQETATAAGVALEDAEGNARPFEDVLADLEAAGIDTSSMFEGLGTDAETVGKIMEIFGLRAGPGMLALLSQGTDGLREFTDEINDSGGTAERVANTQMEGLRGSILLLKSAWEAFMITAMDAGPLQMVTRFVQGMTAVVARLSELPPPLLGVLATIAGLTGVLLTLGGTFLLLLPRIARTYQAFLHFQRWGGVARVIQTAGLSLTNLGRAATGARIALMGMARAHPVLAVLTLLAAGLALAYRTNFLGFADLVDGVVERVRGFATSVQQMFALIAATGKYDGPVAFFRALGMVLGSLTGDAQRVTAIFTEIGIAINRPIQAVRKFIAGIGELVGALIAGDWSKALAKFRKSLAAIGDFLASPAKAVGTFLKSVKTGFKPLDNVLKNAGRVWTNFGRLIQEIFQGDLRGALAVGQRLLRAFADYLRSLGPLIWEGAKAIGRLLVDAFRDIDWGAVGDFLVDGLRGAIDGLIAAAGSIGEAAGALWDWITDSIGDIDWGNVRDTLQSALESAIAGISAALDWVLETGIPAIRGWIVDIAGDVWAGLKALAGWGAGAVSGVIDLALSVLDTLAETVLSGFASAKDWLIDKLPWLEGPLGAAGEALTGAYDLLMTIAGAVASTLDDAWSSARSLIASVFAWLADFFGISDDGSLGETAAKAASAGFDLAFTLAGAFLSTLDSIWSSITDLIGSAADWIAGFFGIGDDGGVTAAAIETASGGFNLAFSLMGSFINWLDGAWSSVTSLIGQAGEWLADFFGISDAGEVGAAVTKTASALFSFAVSVLGSLANFLDGNWSSVKSVIASAASWLADFFGISNAGDVGATVQKAAKAAFTFTLMLFGAIADFLGDGWSSVGDLVNKARHWVSDFFGIKSASDFGQTAQKKASAALTLAAEFGAEITDNLGSRWDSAKMLVGDLHAAAGDLIETGWTGATKSIESTIDFVVSITGSITSAGGEFFDFLFGGGGSDGNAPAVSLESRLNEIATTVETGLQRIADAFAGFDPAGLIGGLNDDLVSAFGGMSGDSIGSAAKAWVERGLAKIGEGITTEGLMQIPRSIDTALAGAFGAMSGESISGGIRGWVARAIGLAATGMDGHGLALARLVDTAAGTGLGTLSGESLSGGITGWLARGIALVAAGLDTLGTSLAIAVDTAAGTGFGTLSGDSLSGSLTAWIDRAQGIAAGAISMDTLAAGVATKLQSAITPKLTQITTAFTTFATNITSTMRTIQTNATREMSTAASNLQRHAATARSNVQRAFRDIETAARTMASSVSREASRAGTDLANRLRNGANQARSAMSSAMNEIVGIVSGAAGRMRSAGYSVGAAAGDGVASGLESALGRVRAAAQNIIQEVDRAMRAEGQIRSPSRLTMWIGQMLGEGPIVGMLSKLDDLRRAASRVMEAATPVLDPRRLDPGLGRLIDDQLARQRRLAALGSQTGLRGTTIGSQHIEVNVTQAPGEDGERFAHRIVSLLVDAYDGVNGLGV
jgi:hypothetical protein